MGQMVMTVKGEIDIDELVITTHTEIGDNYHKVATEYRHNGELVKRTVAVDGLRMPGSQSQQGKMNG